MIDWIKDEDHLKQVRRKHHGSLALAFYGSFSGAAQRALKEWEEFCRSNEDVPLYVVDVQKVRGLHKEFGVTRVPTVLTVEKGKTTRAVEGVQSARFYGVHLGGAAPSAQPTAERRQVRRVTVYSGRGCPACGQVKTYLRAHGISFGEVDISTRPEEAEKLRRRSGYMAVPQTEINGRLVVGFDPAKLAPLLGIQAERRT